MIESNSSLALLRSICVSFLEFTDLRNNSNRWTATHVFLWQISWMLVSSDLDFCGSGLGEDSSREHSARSFDRQASSQFLSPAGLWWPANRFIIQRHQALLLGLSPVPPWNFATLAANRWNPGHRESPVGRRQNRTETSLRARQGQPFFWRSAREVSVPPSRLGKEDGAELPNWERANVGSATASNVASGM